MAYCRWLSDQFGYAVTLPSEAEWEKAARGTDGRAFPWGDGLDPNRANYDDTGVGTTSAVGCFPGGVSLYGIEDLSGNVWEWTRTGWQASYTGYDLEMGVKDTAVVRGGAFFNDEGGVRCAFRLRYAPDLHLYYLGFRVVCGVPHTSEL